MIGQRVIVQLAQRRRYGQVVAESKDKTYWLVLLDGNRNTTYVVKHKVELLKPEQLAFYWR